MWLFYFTGFQILHGHGLQIPAVIIVSKKFNIHCSFRQGAMTIAKDQGVDEVTIEMKNWWRKVQNCQEGLPNLLMSQLYVEISEALTSKLCYSKSL